MERRLGHAESFKDLEVYKQSRVLAKNIFDLTKKFPSEEKYSLTDQIRRSSRSIGAQIAECWGKRRYENHFILKLTDADAEQYETQHWMEVSFECNYIDQSTNNDLIKRCNAIGKMLNSMIDKSSLFCKKNKLNIMKRNISFYISNNTCKICLLFTVHCLLNSE